VKVAVTGGDGLVGRVLRAGISGRFDCRWLSRADADIIDLAALERAFTDADAVVHLAANASVGATFDELSGPNLTGAYNAYEAARRTDVRRFVFASSNHAMGMYQRDAGRAAAPAQATQAAADAPVRPDSLYGATKVWGEALGRMYAEQHGLSVVCLRIGSVTADDRPLPPPGRQLWLSHRDCVSLVEAALTTDVRYAIVNGVSDNVGRWLTLEEGRQLLGWQPRDGLVSSEP
jgi:uronate dehydrogenase